VYEAELIVVVRYPDEGGARELIARKVIQMPFVPYAGLWIDDGLILQVSSAHWRAGGNELEVWFELNWDEPPTDEWLQALERFDWQRDVMP